MLESWIVDWRIFGKHSVNKSKSLLRFAFIFWFLHPKSWPDLKESNPNNFMRHYSHMPGLGEAAIHEKYLRRKIWSAYTVEFIWIMSKYNACSRESIEQLIRTPTMRALLSAHQTRVKELVEAFE